MEPIIFSYASWECAISNGLAAALESGVESFDDLPSEQSDELEEVIRSVNQAIRRVVFSLKYYCRQTNVRETLAAVSNGKEWSLDGITWHSFPLGRLGGDLYITAQTSFRDSEKKAFAQFVNSQDELLPFALRHLHKAQNEWEPRHRWIEATIAAELGIKEFLIRIRPELEPLLLEVPSPPLPKLYGKLLKAYTNVESPVRKELDRGAQTRNELLHKPKSKAITSHEATEYVQAVEVALYHLLTLLRPNDSYIERLYETSRHNLSSIRASFKQGVAGQS